MADKKISQLNAAATIYDADDFAVVQDGETKQANASVVKTYARGGIAGAVVGTTDTQTLTNKTLTAPTINGGSVLDLAQLTVDGNTTLGDASTDTLTINGAAVSIPNGLNFDSNTLFIDSTNNLVGIGTSSPAAKLDVAATIRSTSQVVPTSGSGIELIGGAGTNYLIAYNRTTPGFLPLVVQGSSVSIFGNSTTGLTIDSSGNLGLGVTPSAWSFPGIQSTYGLLSGNNESTIAYNAYYNSGWKYYQTGPSTKYYQASGTHSWHNAPSGTAGNAISFTQAMTLDASGNLGIGVTPNTGYSACLQLKSGITFPATQVTSSNANTLDDYEEGTWTPSVGGTATYIVQDAYYVKIGKVVYVSARFLINVIGTGSTSTISGLPFVSSNTFARGELTVGACATALATPLYSLTLEVVNNNTTIIFQGRTAAGNQTAVSVAMANTSDIHFSGFYFAG